MRCDNCCSSLAVEVEVVVGPEEDEDDSVVESPSLLLWRSELILSLTACMLLCFEWCVEGRKEEALRPPTAVICERSPCAVVTVPFRLSFAKVQ